MAEPRSQVDRRVLPPGMAFGRPNLAGGKIEPNGFAILARASARSAWVMVVFALVLLGAGAALGLLRGQFDPAITLRVPQTVEVAAREAQFATDFPGLSGGFSVKIEAADPRAAERAATRFAEALSADSATFGHVFAPGTGKFFAENRLLYGSTEDVEALVRRAQQMAPLYQALAAAPDLAGLAVLSEKLSQVVSAGRSPEGLDGLFRAAARSIEAMLENRKATLDWRVLIEEDTPFHRGAWTVQAKPLGDPQAALTRARALAASLSGAEAEGLVFSFSGEAVERLSGPGAIGRGLFITASVASVFLLVLFVMGLARPAPLLCIIAGSAAAIATTMGLAALGGLTWTLINAPLPLLLVIMTAGASAPVAVLAEAEKSSGFPPVTALMMAAQRVGAASVFVPAIGLASTAPLILSGFEGAMPLLILTGVATVLVAILALTLTPAFERLVPPVEDGGSHWLDGVFVHGRSLGGVVIQLGATAALIGLAAFGAGLLWAGGGHHAAPQDARSAHVVVAAAEAARAVESLAAIPQGPDIIWAGSYLPPALEAKRTTLAQLTGIYPDAVAAVGERPGAELRASMESLKSSLKVTETAPAAAPELREAAGMLRRSLVLFDSPQLQSEVALRLLNRSLFEGLPPLLQRMNALARQKPVSLSDLDPQLLQRFSAPDGRQRIELRGGPEGIGAAQLAAVRASLPRGGVLHLPQSAEGAGIASAFSVTLPVSLAIIAIILGIWIARPAGILAALLALLAAPLALYGALSIAGHPLVAGLLSMMPSFLTILAAALGIAARARALRGGHGEAALARAALMLPLAGFAASIGLVASTVPELVSLGLVLAAAMAVTLAAVFGLAPLVDGLRRPRRPRRDTAPQRRATSGR